LPDYDWNQFSLENTDAPAGQGGDSLRQENTTRTHNTHALETQQPAHINDPLPPDGAAEGSSFAAVSAAATTSIANSTAAATLGDAYQCNECGRNFAKRHRLKYVSHIAQTATKDPPEPLFPHVSKTFVTMLTITKQYPHEEAQPAIRLPS
jgi:hypothetical protein